jgi:hypothetical protein
VGVLVGSGSGVAVDSGSSVGSGSVVAVGSGVGTLVARAAMGARLGVGVAATTTRGGDGRRGFGVGCTGAVRESAAAVAFAFATMASAVARARAFMAARSISAVAATRAS